MNTFNTAVGHLHNERTGSHTVSDDEYHLDEVQSLAARCITGVALTRKTGSFCIINNQ